MEPDDALLFYPGCKMSFLHALENGPNARNGLSSVGNDARKTPVTWQGTSRICPNQTTTLTGGRNIQRSRKSYYRNLGNAAASVTVSTRLAGTANNHTGRLSNLLIEIAGEVVLIAQVALVRKSRPPNGI